MGLPQLRKCIPLLPAVFVVYFFLHYLVYHPAGLRQEAQTTFDDVSSNPSSNPKIEPAEREGAPDSKYEAPTRDLKAIKPSSEATISLELPKIDPIPEDAKNPLEQKEPPPPGQSPDPSQKETQSLGSPDEGGQNIANPGGEVPQPENPPEKTKEIVAVEQPKIDPIKKPIPNYALNNLKGSTKIGEIYEAGFQNPQMEVCPNNGRYLKVLMLVTTAPDHERQRNAIRQTWGHFSMRKDIAMGFMVGRTFKPEVQTLIDRENERYGDIIEAKFVDHYSNLTLKTIAMFEWAKTYCSETRFILKTDDDMFINVPLLLAFIKTKDKEKRAIFGRLAKGWKPVRNTKSKYYVKVATYNRVRYPEFLTGPAYLLTSDIVDEIYQKALNTTFFFLEDVLLTGFVSEFLQIKRVGDSHFRNSKIKLTDTCQLMKSISIHMVTYEEQFDIYKRTLDGKTKCKIR